MHLDDVDASTPTVIMGVSNVLTSWLPGKFSRFFPAIPVLLGFIYAFVRNAGSGAERFARALTGAIAIAQYSVVRNLAGTKPTDAAKPPT